MSQGSTPLPAYVSKWKTALRDLKDHHTESIVLPQSLEAALFLKALNKTMADFVTYRKLRGDLTTTTLYDAAIEHYKSKDSDEASDHTALMAAGARSAGRRGSSQKKKKPACRRGPQCPFLSQGRCHFWHPASHGGGGGAGARGHQQGGQSRSWTCPKCSTFMRTKQVCVECREPRPGNTGAHASQTGGAILLSGKRKASEALAADLDDLPNSTMAMQVRWLMAETSAKAAKLALANERLQTAKDRLAATEEFKDHDLNLNAAVAIEVQTSSLTAAEPLVVDQPPRTPALALSAEIEARRHVFKVDSGASEHFTSAAVPLADPGPSDRSVIVADGSAVPMETTGDFLGSSADGTNITLKGVHQSSSFKYNLLSVKQAVREGCKVHFEPEGSYLVTPNGTRIPLIETQTGWDIALEKRTAGGGASVALPVSAKTTRSLRARSVAATPATVAQSFQYSLPFH